MKIRKIHLYRISIPFRKAFRHSVRERSKTDNLVVETELESGLLGYGEGLPRDYVTGETQEGVIASLKNLPTRLFEEDLQNPEELIAFLESEVLSRKNLPEDKENNTARSALELSLLDAFSRAFQKTLEEIARIFLKDPRSLPKAPEVRYDGVLSLDGPTRSAWSALKLRIFGFRRVKAKADSDRTSTVKTLRAIHRVLGRRIDLRIDANGAWDFKTALSMIAELSALGVSCLEQPLPHTERTKMKELKKFSPIPLMLDESLCSLEDARTAAEQEWCDLFNIRLSKCGGFLNSLKIARLAREKGLGYQLGCLVGETGILSAAGRHFAAIDPELRYLEGSYDRFLLRDNVVRKDISFGWGGRAEPLTGYGWGVEVDPAKLKRYSTEKVQLYG